MNRAQRRAQEKATPGWLRGKTREQLAQRLVKNGITGRDLEAEYKRGFEDGFNQAIPATYKTIYAAVLIALHRLHGFGRARGVRVLREVDRQVVGYLTTPEAIEAAFKETGILLDFGDGLERVKEVDEKYD